MHYKNNRDRDLITKYKSYAEYKAMIAPYIEKAEAVQNAELVYILKKISGLLPSEAIKTSEIAGIGVIDFSIADIIKELNSLHIRTLASCSGLKEEHKEGVYPAGYISFEDNKESRAFVEYLCGIKERELIFKPELTFTYFIESIIIRFNGCKEIKILREVISEYK